MNVAQLQQTLQANGFFYRGKVDGVIGPLYRAGVKEFQRQNGLTVDGIAGDKTLAKAVAKTKELQMALNRHGAGLAVDGVIGDATIKAIKDFQKGAGLTVDGIVGAKTRRALGQKAVSVWDKAKHFDREEFRCDCRGKYCDGFPVEMDPELIAILEQIRDWAGVPITVTSGIRCYKRNQEVGGIRTSMHLLGKAADIYVPGVPLWKIKDKAYALGAEYVYYGTAQMGNAIHINV